MRLARPFTDPGQTPERGSGVMRKHEFSACKCCRCHHSRSVTSTLIQCGPLGGRHVHAPVDGHELTTAGACEEISALARCGELARQDEAVAPFCRSQIHHPLIVADGLSRRRIFRDSVSRSTRARAGVERIQRGVERIGVLGPRALCRGSGRQSTNRARVCCRCARYSMRIDNKLAQRCTGKATGAAGVRRGRLVHDVHRTSGIRDAAGERRVNRESPRQLVDRESVFDREGDCHDEL